MRVLALEPYYGGSHRAFLDGWTGRSRHDWTVLGLPPHKWKWRMRHSAITLAAQAADRVERGEKFNLIFCSDMLNLAEFKGLAPRGVANLPTVVYFHENQLTYPVRHPDERDLHLGMINISSVLAADQVWFNTGFHRDSFLAATADLLKRMPDHKWLVDIDSVRYKSRVYPQGIESPVPRVARSADPPVILWVARWEHDKNPGLFFEAVERLCLTGEEFRLSVVGEQFDDVPTVFEASRSQFSDLIIRWGYQKSREEYEGALAEADIVVSTSNHEFFGVGIMEAVAAGAFPLLPDRLAYPELFGATVEGGSDDYFYDGSLDHLVARLRELVARHRNDKLWRESRSDGVRIAERCFWKNLTQSLDEALVRLLAPGD